MAIVTTNVKPGGSLITRLTSASVTTGVGAMILGTSVTKWGAIPLPLDLTPAGAPGCAIMTDVLFLFPTPIAASTATVTLPLPNIPGLEGLVLNTQFMVVDAAANNMGLAFSLLGQRVMTKAGGYIFDTAYSYWVGSGDPYTMATAAGKWTNRGDTMLIQHN